MNRYENIGIKWGHAVCYSGYREGQSPETDIHPSYEEVKEDLMILNGKWEYLRLYDCNQHAETVLEIIRRDKLNIRVMLGAFINAEMNNFGCPWGGIYSDSTLEKNKRKNLEKIQRLGVLANEYSDIVFATSAGNEATVDWTDHFVPVERVIEYVRLIKKSTSQPVTFCENYLPWLNKLRSLVTEVDFISIHTYPVWEHKHINEALIYTRQNFSDVARMYPDKPIMITEAGWATNSNGRGINSEIASEDYQELYFNDLTKWSEKEGIITFIFEAFDEPWKGFPEENEPEKHWGLFYENRKPKKVMKNWLR